MIMIKQIALTLIALNLALPVYALVDYTEPNSSRGQRHNPSPKRFKKKSAPVQRTKSKAPSRSASDRTFTLTPSFGFETKDLDNAKVNFYNFGAHLQTSYGIFFDSKYWIASSTSTSFENAKNQAGNIETSLGFNWLSAGEAASRMTLDLAFGAVWGTSDSEFGSSRVDKLITVVTTKRFYHLGLGLEYQLRIVGDPKSAEEISVGNIHRVSAVVGWVASSDISFELEGVLYRISTGGEGVDKLEAPVSCSYLSPKLNLQLAPLIELQLGGRFRAKRADATDKLLGAKLWDLPGVYSNSIFANLNLFL